MEFRKKSVIFFIVLGALAGVLSLLLFQSVSSQTNIFQQTANDLLITDLCLTTEARHTRHPAFPDLFTPFQDLPGGPDRFPSSTLLYLPPEWLLNPAGGEQRP